MIFSTKPNRREILLGSIYLFFNILILPTLLNVVHILLGSPLTDGQLNFVFFALNLLAVGLIFRNYLAASARDALVDPLRSLWYGVLGFLGNMTLTPIVSIICLRIYPEFVSVNDLGIAVLLKEDYVLMAIGTILLAPVAEEVLHRGLVFRSLYDKSPFAAYLVSMVLFSSIHVLGYVGQYEPVLLLLCFLQYLPAAYCLAFSYRYGGTIAAPIIMHILTNAVAIFTMR